MAPSKIKHSLTSLAIIAGFFFILSPAVQAEDWILMESEEFEIQFAIPESWETEVDGDTVTSYGNGVVFVLTAVKDNSISTEELFEIQIENLDMDTEGEVEEIELAGGIIGMLGGGAGIIEGEVAVVMLLAATLDDNNYLAYVFAKPKKFDKFEDTIIDVITSLEPLGFEG